MYRYAALIAGGFYVVFGVLGFIPPLHENWPSDEPMMSLQNGRGFLFGIFPNNFALSLLHVILGLWGVFAFKLQWTSWIFVKGAGLVFMVLAVFGLLPFVSSLAGLFPTFGAIALLHSLTAFGLVAVAGYGRLKQVPVRRERPEPVLNADRVSVASVAGVPVHTFLASFPLAFLLGAVGTDLAHWWTTLDWYAEYDGFWSTASLWLIGAGVAAAIVASVSGLVDILMVTEARKRNLLSLHVLGSMAATALAAINLVLRYRDHDGSVIPWGILLSVLTSGVLVYCGWFAGHLIHRNLISESAKERRGQEVQ